MSTGNFYLYETDINTTDYLVDKSVELIKDEKTIFFISYYNEENVMCDKMYKQLYSNNIAFKGDKIWVHSYTLDFLIPGLPSFVPRIKEQYGELFNAHSIVIDDILIDGLSLLSTNKLNEIIPDINKLAEYLHVNIHAVEGTYDET
jgi:hypothetical protein